MRETGDLERAGAGRWRKMQAGGTVRPGPVGIGEDLVVQDQ